MILNGSEKDFGMVLKIVSFILFIRFDTFSVYLLISFNSLVHTHDLIRTFAETTKIFLIICHEYKIYPCQSFFFDPFSILIYLPATFVFPLFSYIIQSLVISPFSYPHSFDFSI